MCNHDGIAAEQDVEEIGRNCKSSKGRLALFILSLGHPPASLLTTSFDTPLNAHLAQTPPLTRSTIYSTLPALSGHCSLRNSIRKR